MKDLDQLEREAGIDPDSADSRLRHALAKADDDLLERLVQMRKDKGLTQQVVADRMRRDKAAVSNFERLSADPHMSTIRRYAAAIGACVTHVIRDADAVGSLQYERVGDNLPLTDGLLKRHVPHSPQTRIETVWSSTKAVHSSDVISLSERRAQRKAQGDRTGSPSVSAACANV
ncbi:Helix-turn-helix domain protein [Mycobacterium marinum]|uniref:helix-turn-helix domain-containing protein n=1 Tax=Mycobacterium marinum TaxID=1781 RepID=UPI000E3B5A8D|nr:helix-turn-helix transcriptional regulator [Mycobacterium marinum]RFZ03861.1 Helix-turn-helix domain protein [Mycobacterium marinum]